MADAAGAEAWRRDQGVELLQAALAEPAPAGDADTLEDRLANAYLDLQRYDEAIAE